MVSPGWFIQEAQGHTYNLLRESHAFWVLNSYESITFFVKPLKPLWRKALQGVK